MINITDEEFLRESALEALGRIVQEREALDHRELVRIERCRKRGVTWEQIAKVLGYKDRRGAQLRHKILIKREYDRRNGWDEVDDQAAPGRQDRGDDPAVR